VSERLPPFEIDRRLEQCHVSGIIHSRTVTPPATPPAACWTATVDRLDRGQTGPVGVEVRPSDVADIVYTAGTTTGVPKGVLVTHGDLMFNRDPRKRRDFEGSRYFLGPFPVGTGSSQGMVMFALSGAPIVLVLSRFGPEHICERIATLGIDNIMMTPGTAVDLVNSGLEQRYDLSSVRVLAAGASVLLPATAKRVMTMFPNAKIMQYYASLESIPGMTVSIFDPARPGTLGRPSHGTEIKIVDENGAPLPAGQVGEIWMRAPGHKRVYEGNPEGNAHVFTDGWVRMGDHGSVDEEGHLYLFDRATDVIRHGGTMVSSIRVESVIYEHPAVLEACVVGLPHPEFGQVAGAAVVLKTGTRLDELSAFLGARLPEHEVPRQFIVDEFLPRGLIGKVLKREVRKWFADGDGEEARRARRRLYW
jgi:acyl-CoA synthetase (AMP-forming)/AMP-acid ligase II